MAKIKKGDLVQVISGRTQERGGDRGKQGKVIEVLAEKNRVSSRASTASPSTSRSARPQRGTKTGGIETSRGPDPRLATSRSSTPRPRSRPASGSAPRTVERDGVSKTVRVRVRQEVR